MAVDLTRVRGVGLEFDNLSPAGTFVFDDFLAVTAVPEPASLILMTLGLAAVALKRRRS